MRPWSEENPAEELFNQITLLHLTLLTSLLFDQYGPSLVVKVLPCSLFLASGLQIFGQRKTMWSLSSYPSPYHLHYSLSSFPISLSQPFRLPLPVFEWVYLVTALWPHLATLPPPVITLRVQYGQQIQYNNLPPPHPTWARSVFLRAISCCLIPPSVRTSGPTAWVWSLACWYARSLSG